MRTMKWLVGGYATVSALTLGTMIVLRHDTTMVTTAVWIRGSIVAAASLLTLFFAIRAARGEPKMLRRLRFVTTAMLVAVVVIVALPGTFPLWFKLEQVICGLLLLPVVVHLTRRRAAVSA
jgi:hypothetical protein